MSFLQVSWLPFKSVVGKVQDRKARWVKSRTHFKVSKCRFTHNTCVYIHTILIQLAMIVHEVQIAMQNGIMLTGGTDLGME